MRPKRSGSEVLLSDLATRGLSSIEGERQIEKLSHIEKIRIPAELDFMAVRGLRRESALKLAESKPFTLGQASRISGVNPTDISILMVRIEAGRGAREVQ